MYECFRQTLGAGTDRVAVLSDTHGGIQKPLPEVDTFFDFCLAVLARLIKPRMTIMIGGRGGD